MKKILFIGAGFLQHFAIKKAKDLGYYVIAIDANPNAIGFKYADDFDIIDITDVSKCVEFAKKNNIQGVISVATDYGIMSLAEISNELNLPGITLKNAELIKNKYEVRKLLLENNIGSIQQCFQVNNNTINQFDFSKINYPVIVKPVDGSGSQGVKKIDNIKNAKKAVKQAIEKSISKCAHIEDFIDGFEYGVEVFVIDGNPYVLSIMNKKMTKAPYYAELGHEIPSGLTTQLENKIKMIVCDALNVLQINFGAVNLDLLISEDDISIIDIGLRMGGNLIGSHIVPMSTNYDYLGNLIKYSMNDNFDMPINLQKNPVVTRLIALERGVINTLPNWDLIEKEYNVHIFFNKKIGDKVNKYKTNLDSCGYIVGVNSFNVDKVKTYIEENIFN